jgi:DNA-binding response OmpR family regulator
MRTSKPRILIVDDEDINIEIIQFNLMDEDYQIEIARDGAEAWEKLDLDPEGYHVVLLDRMMPNMDGMAVLARMKAHHLLRHTPVILQTAMAAKEEIIEGIQAGAYYYLAKPYDGVMLVSVVRTAVRDSEHSRRIREELRETTHTLGLMQAGTFHYRTLDEARALATLLANACSRPDTVAMGLAELMINAVEHGNLGITYAEKGALNEAGNWESEVEHRLALDKLGQRRVEVAFVRENNDIRITITDQGHGFDWENYLTLSPERAMDNHGRGIAMAGLLSFSQLEYRGRGNQVVAVIKLNPDWRECSGNSG